MENDIRVQYDALCYATFLNIRHITHQASIIAFKNFDATNKEHLFVLSVTMACWNILGEKNIAIDTHKKYIKRFAKKYKKVCDILEFTDNEIYVDVPAMLDFMRPAAIESLGENFTFGEIYDEYYSGKE